jgi:hypothetical protein
VAEIKSTVDLVLEKTRDLTLSREEKQKLAHKELEKKLQGLISRYLDQVIPLSRLHEEVEKTAHPEKDLVYALVKKYLLAHLNLDRDNSLILSALKEICNFDTALLSNLQEEYQSERENTERAFHEKTVVTLQEKGVSGSAVVPNLEKNPDWNQFIDTLQRRYLERIETLESDS